MPLQKAVIEVSRNATETVKPSQAKRIYTALLSVSKTGDNLPRPRFYKDKIMICGDYYYATDTIIAARVSRFEVSTYGDLSKWPEVNPENFLDVDALPEEQALNVKKLCINIQRLLTDASSVDDTAYCANLNPKYLKKVCALFEGIGAGHVNVRHPTDDTRKIYPSYFYGQCDKLAMLNAEALLMPVRV